MILPSPAYTIGSPASANMTINNAPTILEQVSAYTPPAFATYVIPSKTFCHHWDNGAGRCADGGTSSYSVGADFMNMWYDNSPAPQMCGAGFDGLTPSPQNISPGCFSGSFDASMQGVRTAALTVALPAWNGLSTSTFGLDLTNTAVQNPCGVTTTHWAYATAPTNNANPAKTVLVPKYTPITVSYACQPNTVSVGRSDQCMSNGPYGTCLGWWFEHDYDTGYQLANKAVFNGATSSVSHRGHRFDYQLSGCNGLHPAMRRLPAKRRDTSHRRNPSRRVERFQ